MPYVYVEELAEGQEEADVRSADDYNAIEMERDTIIGERDALQRELEDMTGQRDGLAAELDDAKRKFADSFLSSPNKMKQENRDDLRHEDTVSSFDQLFRGRNQYDAN